jgi:type IV pilus assembly protein PilQ
MTQHQRKATMNTIAKFNTRKPLMAALAFGVLMSPNLFAAAVQGLGFTPLPGGEVEVAIKLDGPSAPQVFATENPARIALDFPDTKLMVKERAITVGAGATKAITAVEAANRTRIVVDLFRASGYTTRMDGNTLYLKINNGFPGAAASATKVNASSPAASSLAKMDAQLQVKNVDFRRGKSGEGRILIEFNGDGASADLKSEGGKLVVDVYNAKLAAGAAQRMDVMDFATPVSSVDVKSKGNGVRLEIAANGEYEQLAYQAGNQFVVEISPKKVDEKKKGVNDPPVYAGTRATYNFQDIPVRSVLQLIADTSELNIVVADSVQGNVTVRLINVPWDQALDIVLQAKGLDKRRNGGIIYVAPTDEIAKREQALEDARLALEDRQSLITDYIPISYGKAEDIAKLLTSESLRGQNSSGGGQQQAQSDSGFLSKRGSLSFDIRTNTLILVDIPTKVAQIRDLVARLDRAVEQVLIESRIVVANDDYAKELGVKFGISGAQEDKNGNIITVGGTLRATDTQANQALQNRLRYQNSGLPVGVPGQPDEGIKVPSLFDRLGVNLPVANAAGSFGTTVLGNDYLLDLELSALESQGRGEIISSPRVITASQREAVISQGTEIPYTVQTVSATGGVSISTQFKPVVLELKVTPTISPDQRIFLNLQVKQDSVGSFAVNGQPAINTRNVSTAVLVDNGQTVVLGGILERSSGDRKRQVPVLGDVPVLGNLFKTTSKSAGRRELLIFVTPKILQDSLR